MSNKLLFGKIVGAHGIKGFLKVQYFTETPYSLVDYGPLTDESGEKLFDFEIKNAKKGNVIIAMKGIETRNDAELLIGQNLYIDEDLLPETDDDEFYHKDLEGMSVVSSEDEEIGTVKAVVNFGAGDLLEIILKSGKSELIPFHKDYVLDIDQKAQKIIVEMPIYLETSPEERNEE